MTYVHPLLTNWQLAFILYRQHYQAAVVAQNPGLANPEISKVIGEQWRDSPPEVKKHWKSLADVCCSLVERRTLDFRPLTPYRKKSFGIRNSIPTTAISHVALAVATASQVHSRAQTPMNRPDASNAVAELSQPQLAFLLFRTTPRNDSQRRPTHLQHRLQVIMAAAISALWAVPVSMALPVALTTALTSALIRSKSLPCLLHASNGFRFQQGHSLPQIPNAAE